MTTPSDLELWTREISYVSWIGLGWLICAPYLLNPTSYGHDTPFDTTKIEVFLEDMPAPIDPCEPNPRIMVDFRGPYLKI